MISLPHFQCFRQKEKRVLAKIIFSIFVFSFKYYVSSYYYPFVAMIAMLIHVGGAMSLILKDKELGRLSVSPIPNQFTRLSKLEMASSFVACLAISPR